MGTVRDRLLHIPAWGIALELEEDVHLAHTTVAVGLTEDARVIKAAELDWEWARTDLGEVSLEEVGGGGGVVDGMTTLQGEQEPEPEPEQVTPSSGAEVEFEFETRGVLQGSTLSVPDWGLTLMVDDLGAVSGQDTMPREVVVGLTRDGVMIAPEIGQVWVRDEQQQQQGQEQQQATPPPGVEVEFEIETRGMLQGSTVNVPEWGLTLMLVDDPEAMLGQDTTPREVVVGMMQDGVIAAPEIGHRWVPIDDDEQQQQQGQEQAQVMPPPRVEVEFVFETRGLLQGSTVSVPEWELTLMLVDDPEAMLGQDMTPREVVVGMMRDGVIAAPEIGHRWVRIDDDEQQQQQQDQQEDDGWDEMTLVGYDFVRETTGVLERSTLSVPAWRMTLRLEENGVVDEVAHRDTTRREVQIGMVRGGRVIAAPEIRWEWETPSQEETRRRAREERRRRREARAERTRRTREGEDQWIQMAAAVLLGLVAAGFVHLSGRAPRAQETGRMVGGLDNMLDLPRVDGPGERSEEEDIQPESEERRPVQNAEDTPPNEDSTVDRFLSLPAALPEDNNNEGQQEEPTWDWQAELHSGPQRESLFADFMEGARKVDDSMKAFLARPQEKAGVSSSRQVAQGGSGQERLVAGTSVPIAVYEEEANGDGFKSIKSARGRRSVGFDEAGDTTGGMRLKVDVTQRVKDWLRVQEEAGGYEHWERMNLSGGLRGAESPKGDELEVEHGEGEFKGVSGRLSMGDPLMEKDNAGEEGVDEERRERSTMSLGELQGEPEEVESGGDVVYRGWSPESVLGIEEYGEVTEEELEGVEGDEGEGLEAAEWVETVECNVEEEDVEIVDEGEDENEEDRREYSGMSLEELQAREEEEQLDSGDNAETVDGFEDVDFEEDVQEENVEQEEEEHDEDRMEESEISLGKSQIREEEDQEQEQEQIYSGDDVIDGESLVEIEEDADSKEAYEEGDEGEGSQKEGWTDGIEVYGEGTVEPCHKDNVEDEDEDGVCANKEMIEENEDEEEGEAALWDETREMTMEDTRGADVTSEGKDEECEGEAQEDSQLLVSVSPEESVCEVVQDHGDEPNEDMQKDVDQGTQEDIADEDVTSEENDEGCKEEEQEDFQPSVSPEDVCKVMQDHGDEPDEDMQKDVYHGTQEDIADAATSADEEPLEELLTEKTKEESEIQVYDEGENESDARDCKENEEAKDKIQRGDTESDYDLPSFLDERSTPADLPDFDTRSQLKASADSWDNNRTTRTPTDYGDVLGELENDIGSDDEENDYGPKSHDELPSFLDDLSTPSIPGFYTRSSLPAPDDFRDNGQTSSTAHQNILDGLDNDRGEKGNDNEEEQQGPDGPVSYRASFSPQTPTVLILPALPDSCRSRGDNAFLISNGSGLFWERFDAKRGRC